MKTKIYAIVFALLLASWAGNYAYSRISQLPEAGFLKHYIETRTVPSVAFELLYVANKTDKRKIVGAHIEELPMIKFYPAQIHQELSHQTIYKLMGYYDENSSWPAADSQKVTKVNALFSDGSMSEEEIGEIVVTWEAWPRGEVAEGPIQMSSGMSSSNNEGSATVRIERPVTFTGVSSHWLEKLGPLFEFEVRSTSERGTPNPRQINDPVELEAGQSLKLEYRFLLSRRSPQALEVYNLQLRENFEEPSGETRGYTVFANYLPYPSESQMRAYVREKRRQAG